MPEPGIILFRDRTINRWNAYYEDTKDRTWETTIAAGVKIPLAVIEMQRLFPERRIGVRSSEFGLFARLILGPVVWFN